jgi:CubicO group peptidase (beta-lactamase class C family)
MLRGTHAEMLGFHAQIDGINWQYGGPKTHYHFLRRTQFLPHALIYRQGEIALLPEALRPDVARCPVQSERGLGTLEQVVERSPVNGMIILHHGRIVFERYPRMRPFDKHLFMSVTKAFVGTLVGLFTARGLLDLDQTVEHYLPETAGSGWQGVSLRDVLDMASGIAAPEEEEGFSNPAHPYYQFEASLGWLPPTAATLPSTYDYVAALPRQGAPGQAFEYTSVNTFLLAWILERQADLPLNEILTQEIWSKIGAEADALLAISPFGAPAAGGGMYASLRDLARFGLLFTPSAATVLPQAFLPASLLDAIQGSGRSELFDRGPTGPGFTARLHGERPRHNTYQWDYVMPDGDFFKGGYGGQGLYISPSRDLVVAYFGVPFEESFQTHELQWITRQLLHQGLFD